MLNYKIKIGLIPDVRDLGDFATRKGIFEPAKGVDRKNDVVKYIKIISLMSKRNLPIWNGLMNWAFSTKMPIAKKCANI